MIYSLKSWRLLAVVLPVAAIFVFGTTRQGFDLFEFDSQRVVSGEFWRLLTCQFAHYDAKHALQNMLTTAVLIWVGLRLGAAKEMAIAFVLCLITIPATILFVSGFELFAGMSGIGVSLATVCAVVLAKDKQNIWRLLLVACLLGYLVIPRAVFADASEVATEAHWAGFFTGIVAVWIARYSLVAAVFKGE